MHGESWVSEFLASEQAWRMSAKGASTRFTRALVAFVFASLAFTVGAINKTLMVKVACYAVCPIAFGLFVWWLVAGIREYRKSRVLFKHASGLYDEHGGLTTQNTRLAQLRGHLAGWKLIASSDTVLHLTQERTSAQVRTKKFWQVAAGVGFGLLFAACIWNLGWGVSVGSGSVSAFKLKLLVWAMPLISLGLIIASLVPTTVEFAADADAQPEILIEYVTLKGVRTETFEAADIEALRNSDVSLEARLRSGETAQLILMLSLDHASRDKRVAEMMKNIMRVRMELLLEAVERIVKLKSSAN